MSDTPAWHPPSTQVSANLHEQCLNLLAELDEFQSLLKRTLRNPQLVEVRQFRSSVNSELKMLQKLEQRLQSSVHATEHDDPGLDGRLVHAMRSSNLPFYQAVWNVAKGSCEGLVALGKRFYWDSEPKSSEARKRSKKREGEAALAEKQPNKDKRKSVFVDVVAGDGEEWVKVSTIPERRLLFEMAEKGWERDGEEEYLSDRDGDGPVERTVLRHSDGLHSGDEDEDEDDDELELIRLARDLRKAANATRVRYRHPRVRVVLPKIEEGNVPEIDDIIREMRSYDIQVECQETLSDASGADLTRLLPQPFKNFTPTLNVDCTLLLALVSDISHIRDIPPSPRFHRALVRQMEVEKEQPLLPTELWPAMGDHELVCTTEAATRMREIVDTIGTDAERSRMKIMMGDVPYDQMNHQALVQEFGRLSDYQIPADWKIPVREVDAQPVIDTGMKQRKLPSVADEVAKGLSDINHSVFMYGWVAGMTTISSNRTIDKQIETTVERLRHGDEELQGPDVWVCDTARSLVGKDKDRKT